MKFYFTVDNSTVKMAGQGGQIRQRLINKEIGEVKRNDKEGTPAPTLFSVGTHAEGSL